MNGNQGFSADFEEIKRLFSSHEAQHSPLLDADGSPIPRPAPSGLYYQARIIQFLIDHWGLRRDDAQKILKPRLFLLDRWMKETHPAWVALDLTQSVTLTTDDKERM